MWCPQIKDVAHVSRRRPGVSGRWLSATSLEKLGEEGPQAANGPDGENPIEQVERLAPRTGSRAFVRTLQHRGAGT